MRSIFHTRYRGNGKYISPALFTWAFTPWSYWLNPPACSWPGRSSAWLFLYVTQVDAQDSGCTHPCKKKKVMLLSPVHLGNAVAHLTEFTQCPMCARDSVELVCLWGFSFFNTGVLAKEAIFFALSIEVLLCCGYTRGKWLLTVWVWDWVSCVVCSIWQRCQFLFRGNEIGWRGFEVFFFLNG